MSLKFQIEVSVEFKRFKVEDRQKFKVAKRHLQVVLQSKQNVNLVKVKTALVVVLPPFAPSDITCPAPEILP